MKRTILNSFSSIPFACLALTGLLLSALSTGHDLDGRLYRVTATITDLAGHTATSTTEILVPHDQGNH